MAFTKEVLEYITTAKLEEDQGGDAPISIDHRTLEAF
jgi:hypothetical protein